jgi:hypothetical protein
LTIWTGCLVDRSEPTNHIPGLCATQSGRLGNANRETVDTERLRPDAPLRTVDVVWVAVVTVRVVGGQRLGSCKALSELCSRRGERAKRLRVHDVALTLR